MKSREIKKIKPNKVVSGVFVTLSILSFIVYHLCISVIEIKYLFFILFTFFASIMICSAKYYNFRTIYK